MRASAPFSWMWIVSDKNISKQYTFQFYFLSNIWYNLIIYRITSIINYHYNWEQWICSRVGGRVECWIKKQSSNIWQQIHAVKNIGKYLYASNVKFTMKGCRYNVFGFCWLAQLCIAWCDPGARMHHKPDQSLLYIGQTKCPPSEQCCPCFFAIIYFNKIIRFCIFEEWFYLWSLQSFLSLYFKTERNILSRSYVITYS